MPAKHFLSVKTKLGLVFLALVFGLYQCEPDTNESLEGQWLVTEDNETPPYYVTIGTDAEDPSRIYITNFLFLGTEAEAYGNVSGNSINLPVQPVDAHTISGSGTIINNNRLSFDITDDDGGGEPLNISAIFTRN